MSSVIRGNDNFDSSNFNGPAFESAEQTYGTGITSVSHGLGRIPYWWVMRLRCKTANNGYAVGDEIDETSTVDGDGGRGYVTWANTTTVYHSRDGTGLQNTSADFTYPTTSHWRIVFYCW